jgi:peptidoglycan/LPS O-acetylase OafA/YrhL
VVVLDELVLDPEILVDVASVGLVEEATVVPVDRRANQDRAVDSTLKAFHRGESNDLEMPVLAPSKTQVARYLSRFVRWMTTTTLDAFAGGRENNFDVLRLLGASLVLVSHAFVVSGAAEPTIGRWPLGTFGVEIFFAISGFLIAMSWLNRPGLRGFAVRRGLRILPALAVAVVLSALLLGPAITTLSPSAYLTNPETPGYVADNLVSIASGGFLHGIALDLPGVFQTQPDHAVNLSLWTLPIEVRAYGILALLGIVGLLRGTFALTAAAFFALSVAPAGVVDLPLIGSPLDFLRGADGLAAHLTAMFFVSAALYRYRARIPLRLDLVLVAVVATVALLGTPLERPVLLIAVPYVVLCAAYLSSSGLRRLTLPGDVSYGVYLVAFPVQQTIVELWGGGGPGPLTVILIAFPISYLLALASWHGVEKRALGLKHRLAPARRSFARTNRPDVVDSAPAPSQP